MLEHNKVYIITEGKYSDYHIVAIFLTKEEAQYYMNATKGYSDSMEIEEYEISKTNSPNIDMRFWYDIIYCEAKNSFEIYAKIAPFSLSNRKIPPFDINLLNVVSPCNVFNTNKKHLEVLVRANEDEKAMKIAQDLIAEYKAKREGVV